VITLKELESSTEGTGVSVHRTTISLTYHRGGLGRVARNKPLVTEAVCRKACGRLVKHMDKGPLVR